MGTHLKGISSQIMKPVGADEFSQVENVERQGAKDRALGSMQVVFYTYNRVIK